MQAILLIPGNGSQFHLGETGLDDSSDLLHSDTLFSALANVYECALSGARTFIELVEKGKLSFSSGLYVILNTDSKEPPLLFLPKPTVTYSNVVDRKRYKNIKYFSLGVWAEFRNSFNAEKVESGLNFTAKPLVGNEFMCLDGELGSDPKAFQHCSFRGFTTSPKVKVHTTLHEDRLYHETTVQFNSFVGSGQEYEGAYCVLFRHDLTDEQYREFIAALRIMADEGVGGQRSSGKGQFREVREVTIDIPEGGEVAAYLGLSIVSPADDSELNALERYELCVRGGGSLGWRGDQEKHRKQARFVREGAVMSRNISGRVVDLSPDAETGSIKRNGRNFAIPI
ncbi:MAG: type III-A CRISPR-associated RAMP protein Csm4 [Chlorobium limicola]|nr:type III-A CRISPR-associated RAMP protein Csm4 [Chlorobium limicola]